MLAPVEDWYPQTTGQKAKTQPGESNNGGRGGDKKDSRKRPPGGASPQGGKKTNGATNSNLQITDGREVDGGKEQPVARRNLKEALQDYK